MRSTKKRGHAIEALVLAEEGLERLPSPRLIEGVCSTWRKFSNVEFLHP